MRRLRVAVRREVLEEVGLEVVAAREVARVPYPSGTTTVFRVEVAGGEPRLGVDDLARVTVRGWLVWTGSRLRRLRVSMVAVRFPC
jgi:8-oxo-dGTP pyrophosphatase MutT (NUDIX family)